MDIFGWEMMDWKSGVEFSFDMTLREFFYWLLDLPISIYILVILFTVSINILIWYIKHPPRE